ncbi:hypothetical protein L195_g036400, partial [Trifolium pratense]
MKQNAERWKRREEKTLSLPDEGEGFYLCASLQN